MNIMKIEFNYTPASFLVDEDKKLIHAKKRTLLTRPEKYEKQLTPGHEVNEIKEFTSLHGHGRYAIGNRLIVFTNSLRQLVPMGAEVSYPYRDFLTLAELLYWIKINAPETRYLQLGNGMYILHLKD